MRKVYVEAKVSLIIRINENVDVHDFLSSLVLESNFHNSDGDVEDF